jgi:hypothetical protein
MDANENKYKWARFKRWFYKNRKIIIIVVLVIGCIGGGIATYIILSKPVKSTQIKKVVKKPKPAVKYYSPLTGSLVPNEATTKQATTAIMIENSPDARPQSGLNGAGVVFEAIAEGGITRFLTIFQENKPQLIGPVRSLRLYYIDWLAPFNASVAHVGGSAAALAEIRNGNYRDIDQFFNPGSYWRATDRYAPHNVYTSFEKLDALNNAKGFTTSIFTGFSRIDGKPVKTPNATGINISISSSLYNSTYVYDKTTNTYARSLAGAPHTDRESGIQITPRVVIALRVNETTVFEDGFRQSIETIGSGEAVIFQNGTIINATWHKNSKLEQITFTDAKGKDIPLVRGQTWISAVPNGSGGVVWQ